MPPALACPPTYITLATALYWWLSLLCWRPFWSSTLTRRLNRTVCPTGCYTYPIMSVLNSSLSEQWLPQTWKLADVVPIPMEQKVKNLSKHVHPISVIALRGKDSHIQHAVTYMAKWSSCNLMQLNAAKINVQNLLLTLRNANALLSHCLLVTTI